MLMSYGNCRPLALMLPVETYRFLHRCLGMLMLFSFLQDQEWINALICLHCLLCLFQHQLTILPIFAYSKCSNILCRVPFSHFQYCRHIMCKYDRSTAKKSREVHDNGTMGEVMYCAWLSFNLNIWEHTLSNNYYTLSIIVGIENW